MRIHLFIDMYNLNKWNQGEEFYATLQREREDDIHVDIDLDYYHMEEGMFNTYIFRKKTQTEILTQNIGKWKV